jgi:hypothetical protein
VVNVWTRPTDVTNVSINADLFETTIPRPRSADDVRDDVALEVREWRRLGRHCLFVEAVDGRTVGILNVNSGEATLTNEKERSLFEAAIAGWFAAALDSPAALSQLTDHQTAVNPTPSEPAVEATVPEQVVEPVVAESRVVARARARGEGRTAAVRSLFARIMEEHMESTREQQVPAQVAEVDPPVTGSRMSLRAQLRAARSRPEIGSGRHRGGQEDPVAGQVLPEVGEPGIPQQRPGGRHRAERVSKS